MSSDQQDKGLQLSVQFDRSTASRLGITPQMIDDALYDAFGQRQVSTIFTQLNQYRVVLAVKPDFQKGPDALQNIYLRGTNGGQVPLGRLSKPRRPPDRSSSTARASSPLQRSPSTWHPGRPSEMRLRP